MACPPLLPSASTLLLCISRCAGLRPNSQNIAGVKKVSSKAELIKPLKMTTATGYSTSVPGRSASDNSGASVKR
jgi:hypothetical protein